MRRTTEQKIVAMARELGLDFHSRHGGAKIVYRQRGGCYAFLSKSEALREIVAARKAAKQLS